MNLQEIDENDIFILDNSQINTKNMLMDKYKNLNLIWRENRDGLDIVIEWFNNKLKSDYKNLEEIGRNISEDICIVKKIGDQYRLIALSVAFLNRWRTEEKIGKNLFQIHKPVPDSKPLVTKINSFFDLITENIPYRRKNWGFVKTDELHLPFDKIKQDNGELYLRTETQTIIKVEKYIIFLIKTDLEKMVDKNQLKRMSQKLSPEMLKYKLLESKL